jgi:hypothetical protein
MPLLDLFLGDSLALREAERLLREQEDRVFKLVDGEDCDLGVHVRADIPRFEALNARERLGQARQDRKADAHLLVMTMGFVIILAKLFGGFDLVMKGLSVL